MGRKIAWFAFLWVAGVTATAMVSLLMRAALPR